MSSTDERLFELCAGLVQGLGFRLIDVRETSEYGRRVFRFFVDREQGVSVDECGTVSRELSYFLDAEDPVEGAYSLEVSSPGLDHDLVREREYTHFAGRQARLVLRTSIDGIGSVLLGELVGASGGTVTVRHDGRGEIQVAMRDIARARLEL